MITFSSLFMVPAIIAIASGSVILVSKAGGRTASRQIRALHGIIDEENH